MVRSAVLLAIILALYWIGLSGYFTTMLLTLGGISIVLVIYLCKRMQILDGETAPYIYIPQTLYYFVWLGKEIVKANIAVVKTVLKPDMVITPTLVKVPVKNKSDLGRSMFANSITLTPGTVSVDFDADEILVHALLKNMADPENFVEMAERAGASVGDKITSHKTVSNAKGQ